MALNFQDIPIPLTEGQTAGRDQALIQMPEPLKITNGEFGDRGNIRIIDGMTNLPVTSMTGETAPDDTNPTLRRLLSHKDELLLETYKGIYRQQVGGKFALAAGSNNRKRDTLRCMRMGVTSIADSHGSSGDDWAGDDTIDAGIIGVDAAQLGDYTCTVWVEKYGIFPNAYAQVMWQIRHKTSDALVGRGRLRDSVTNVISEPRVVAFGGQFRIYAISGGDLAYLFIDPASTQNVNETMTKLTAVGTYLWFDVALSPTQVCISAALSTPAVQSFVFNQATPTVLIGAPAVAIAGTPTPVANFYVNTGGAGVNQAFVVFYACAGSYATLRWFAVTPAAASLGAAAQALATVSIGRPIAIKDYTGSTATYPLLIDGVQAGGALVNFVVTSVQYNATAAAPGVMASAGTDTVIVREHICAGLPVSVSGSSYSGTQQQGFLLPVQFASTTQNTFQVLDIARPLTQALAGGQVDANFSVLRVFDAGPLFPTHIPPLVGVFLIGRVCTPVLVPDSGGLSAHFWSAKFTPNITNVTQLGQNPTNLQRNTLSYADKLGHIEFADLTYMAGGTPLVYDGQDLFEEGYTFAPEITSVTPAGAGGPLSAGSYSIVYVYEWFDGQGNRWQSAPSAPSTFTAVLANTYTAVVRALRTTLRSGVQVIPYRTVANGTVFYRDNVTNLGPLTDTTLQSSELLYTGPGSTLFLGTQSNNALPGVKNFTEHQNRLVAIGGEFDRGFFYSKERALRFPAEFNRAAGFGQVPGVVGRTVAGASLDDKLVLFAESGVAVVFGQGPNFNWLQNGYTAPARIQAAEGIRFDTPFIAEVDDGVWYVTSTGPRLLSRGLATAKGANGLPLGEGLRNSSQKIISACEVVVTHPTKAQVLFCSTADATTYVYDYQRDKWTERNDVTYPLSAVSTRSTLYVISNGDFADADTLRFEDPNDVLAPNALSLETGWISFAGVQRFQRFTNLQILGSTLTKGILGELTVGITVYEAHDPANPVQNTATVVTAASGLNCPWMVEFQMIFQTGTAYKLFITVSPESAATGNFSITSLLARVGSKRGGAKLPNAQRG